MQIPVSARRGRYTRPESNFPAHWNSMRLQENASDPSDSRNDSDGLSERESDSFCCRLYPCCILKWKKIKLPDQREEVGRNVFTRQSYKKKQVKFGTS